MASLSVQTPEIISGSTAIKKINNAVYEFHRPSNGLWNLDMIFFHGFQEEGSQDAYRRTWMVADGSTCWLNTWLPEFFPQSRVMSVSYDASTEVSDTGGRMDMFLLGENLAQSIIDNAGVGQSCPVVLVGHGLGGLVLKEVCCRAQQLGASFKAEEAATNPYVTFLTRLKGAFFFSTPQLGTRTNLKRKRPSPLLKYCEFPSAHSARLTSAFHALRKSDRYGWKTCGVIEANITGKRKTLVSIPSAMRRLFGWKSQSAPVVEEGSGRNDMDVFSVLTGEDSSTICKPKERASSSFQFLLNFVQKIIKDEECALKMWRSTLPEKFIGMPNRLKQVVQKLQLGRAEPSKVSLVGMGGVGKSTLAKELLAEIRSQFDFVCFVDDVKGRLKQNNLQTLIADNLYYGNGSKVGMQDVNVQSLWKLLQGKKVFLVMDNVDSEEQISSILVPAWVRKGSRLVVTSRERTEKSMPSFVMHEVPFLSMEESVSLFQAHVDTQVVREIPRNIFHKVVAKCDGLPLTVEVIGSYLRDVKDVDLWKEALERLRKARSMDGSDDDKLWAKLRVSFNSLALLEKEMFLDLAMFDKCEVDGLQYDLDVWGTIWAAEKKSMVTTGLMNLANKCFIRISPKFGISSLSKQLGEDKLEYLAIASGAKFVYIHEQLRDLGRNTVLGDLGRSTLRPSAARIELCRGVWQSEDVNELLARYKGDNAQTETLYVGVNQNVSGSNGHFRNQYAWSSIGRLRYLRLLRMSKVGMSGEGAQRFPSNVVFLQMSRCFRGKAVGSFPFYEGECWPIRDEDVGVLHKLAVLILENCPFVRFPAKFYQLSNLRILIISGMQVTELPEKFGLLPSLRVLILEQVGLSKLPDSFLQLPSLQSLEIRGCSALETLPALSVPKSTLLTREDVLSPLSMLTRLTLENLQALRELPESFGLLGSLEQFVIKGCPALSTLPESLGLCHNLKDLKITRCGGLECLGEPFRGLKSLSSLSITFCPRLRCLPNSLGQLKMLRLLDIQNLGISSLPASLWDLHKLPALRLHDLEYLKHLPEHMDTARTIDGQNLQRLCESRPVLRSLEELTITRCGNLQSLPECLGHIGSLKRIQVHICKSLQRLPESLALLKNLEYLNVAGCESLRSLPECLGQVDSLKAIHINSCRSLERLPEFGAFRNLEILDLDDCESLRSLPECLGKIDSLKSIYVGCCSSLERLPESVGQLRNLTGISLVQCESLKSLPECLGQIDSLKTIYVYFCSSLERLPESFGGLRNLEILTIEGCEGLKRLPEYLGHTENKSLRLITVSSCSNLDRLPYGLLRNLQNLNISGCDSHQRLPDSMGLSENLQLLDIKGMWSLERSPGSCWQLQAPRHFEPGIAYIT